jgi:hypothetical protein
MADKKRTDEIPEAPPDVVELLKEHLGKPQETIPENKDKVVNFVKKARKAGFDKQHQAEFLTGIVLGCKNEIEILRKQIQELERRTSGQIRYGL